MLRNLLPGQTFFSLCFRISAMASDGEVDIDVWPRLDSRLYKARFVPGKTWKEWRMTNDR